MGYWVCEDFPGERFYDKAEIRRFLSEELEESASSTFPDWLERNFDVHALFVFISTTKKGENAAETVTRLCEDEFWKSHSYLWEGTDGDALDHRFVWEFDDREGLYDRKPLLRLFKRGKSAPRKPMRRRL